MGSELHHSRRRRRFFGVLVISLALVVAGCGDDSSDGGSGGGRSEPGPFRAATFNAGLAVGFVDQAEERAPVVADALAQLDAELLVVQEVWEPEHVTMVEDATEEQFPNRIFLEPQSGEAYVYGGSFGIGVLTDQEIVDQDTLVLESSLNRRAVIYAELDTDRIGPVHVFATHLSAIFADIPFPGDGTWEQEQADQIDAMLAFIDETVDDENPVLVMGDVNTGPEGANYRAEFVENYDALLAGGPFDSPYAEDPAALCTYCDANALVESEGNDGLLIDHILVRDFDGTVEVERILDEEVDVEVDGETVMLPPSDHYGLLALLTPTGG